MTEERLKELEKALEDYYDEPLGIVNRGCSELITEFRTLQAEVRILRLWREGTLAERDAAIDVAERADEENFYLRKLIRDIQATCGHPDAAEGCRIILKRIDAALGDMND
jgi:hypothetical protein